MELLSLDLTERKGGGSGCRSTIRDPGPRTHARKKQDADNNPCDLTEIHEEVGEGTTLTICIDPLHAVFRGQFARFLFEFEPSNFPLDPSLQEIVLRTK